MNERYDRKIKELNGKIILLYIKLKRVHKCLNVNTIDLNNLEKTDMDINMKNKIKLRLFKNIQKLIKLLKKKYEYDSADVLDKNRIGLLIQKHLNDLYNEAESLNKNFGKSLVLQKII